MNQNNQWRLIDTPKGDAFYNMALDEAIAMAVINGSVPPTLRFYGWITPSISVGYFQRIDDIDLEYCHNNNLPIVRRPTGGRAILHDQELTYSFSARNDHGFSGGLYETYARLAMAFSEALMSLGLDVEIMERKQRGEILRRSPLCFGSLSLGEITHRGTKLIGSAQRRWKEGFLQQGTLPFTIDRERIKRVFKIPVEHSLELKGLRAFIEVDSKEIKMTIVKAFERIFNIKLVLSHPSEEEILLTERLLREKYLQPKWNLGQWKESLPEMSSYKTQK